MTHRDIEPRELALGGLFGAAALVLPFLFHLVSLGAPLLPMYLPLMALAFLVRPAVAAATAFAAPLLSALLTGMPPWYPPVAPAMAIELPIMAAAAAALWRRRPGSVLAVLMPVLLLGRLIQFGLHYLMGLLLDLPPEFLSIASLIATLPGIGLMIVVIPPLYRLIGLRHLPAGTGGALEEDIAPIRAYFDARADDWDAIIDLDRVTARLHSGLDELGIGSDERILDLGCGTGVLLGVLLERLGPAARVEAVDLAPRMIARASVKHPDARVRFHVAGAARLPLPDASVDRAVCFSVWPHLHDPDAVIAELERVLRPGGTVHVWHVDGRETIDAIHRGAGEAVGDDRLEPADALAGRFRRRGFTVTEAVDTADTYRVTAVSSAPEAS